MSKKAQGTIEYLVILAVVVIVALIVVSLIIGSTTPAQGISGTTTQIASASNILAVTESIVSEDGNYFLKIKNNSGENITITNITIGDNTPATPYKMIPTNAEEAFILATNATCSQGQLLAEEITITYTNQYDLTKKQTYPVPINFECENFTATITYTDETGATHEEDGGIIEPPAGPDCGNGNIDTGEDCDGSNLNSEDCLSQGYDGGTLTCSACSFSYSNCTMNPITLSTYITDFSGGEFEHAVLGSVTPNGELDWNTDDTGQELISSNPLASGLVGLWNLNEGSGATTFNDASTNENNGSCTQCPAQTTGLFDNAFDFDGINDYIEIPYDSSLSVSNGLTMSSWVYYQGNGARNNWFIFAKGATNIYGMGRGDPDGTSACGQRHFFVGLAAPTWLDYCTSYDIFDNQWYLLTTTYDRQYIRFYVNGEEVHSIAETDQVAPFTNENVYLGGYPQSAEYSDVILEDTFILDEALSAAEVAELYSLGKGQWVDEDLVAYYKFNGDATDTARGNHGTWSGTEDYSDGMFGSQAGEFNGINYSKVAIGTPLGTAATKFSALFWFKGIEDQPANTISFITIKGPGAWTNGEWGIQYGSSTDTTYLQYRPLPSGPHYQLPYVNQVLDGKWHQMAMVVDTSEVILYIDGADVASIPISGVGGMLGNTTYIAGDGYPNPSFKGNIDEVKLYKKALSPTEVLADYEASLGSYTSTVEPVTAGSTFTEMQINTTGPFYGEELDLNEDLAQGLVGLWHLNEASGDAQDSSGNNNNGVVNGATQGQAGVFDNAYEFDGAGNYLNVGHNSSLAPASGKISISAWVKPEAKNTYPKTILEKREGLANNCDYRLFITNDDHASRARMLYFAFFAGGNWRGADGPAVPNDKWSNISVTFDSATSKLTYYLNGIAQSETVPYTIPADVSTEAWIGRGHHPTYPYYFKGVIDEVAIWDRTLGANEVKELFNKGTARIGTQYKVCDDAACSGESWSSTTYPSTGSITLTGTGDYFQFKNNFEWIDLGSEQTMYNAYATLEDVNIIYQN